MRRPAPLLFIIINVIVTLVVALAVVSLFSSQNPQQAPVQVITVEVRITNTPDPNSESRVVIITATPQPGTQAVAALPTGILDTPAADASLPVTFDAEALSGDTPLQGTATALPANCILHVIQSGDTPFGLAQVYGADGFAIMELNGLTDETASALQIGDVLIVPLEGCPLTAADLPTTTPEAEETVESAGGEVTEEATAESTAEATARATLTLPPTAANAQVEIVEAVGVGDITAEGISIRNVGNSINLSGWTLKDAEGNTYTFGERLVFSNASITLFTRVGQDTPILLFWNRNAAVLAAGDVLTLSDRNGVVQSTYRVPGTVELP